MGLSVIARGATAPAHAPVFGNLVHTQNMEFCLRANSTLNAFDLSDNALPISDPSGNALYTQRGLSIVSSKGGIAVPSLFLAGMSSYTLSGVIAVDDLDLSGSVTTAVLGGDFSGSSGASTNASSVLSIDKNATTGLPEIRAFFGAKKKTAAESQQLPHIFAIPTSLYNVSNNFAQIKAMYIAMSIKIDEAAGLGQTRVYVKSAQSDFLAGSDLNLESASMAFDAASKLSQQPKGVRPITVGYVSDGYDDPTSKHIKEFRVDGDALTSQQIEDQYQATKKWLLAEGVVDISHWR